MEVDSQLDFLPPPRPEAAPVEVIGSKLVLLLGLGHSLGSEDFPELEDFLAVERFYDYEGAPSVVHPWHCRMPHELLIMAYPLRVRPVGSFDDPLISAN